MNSTVESLRPQIEPKIKESLDPLFKAQGELTDKIKDGAMGIIDPILKEHVVPHLSKIVEAIKSPMVEGFDVTYKLYNEAIDKYDFKGKDEVKKGFHDLDYVPHSWAIWSAYEKVDVMYEPLWALRIVFEDIYPWSLIWQARDTLRGKLDNAIYTFEERLLKFVEEGETTDSKAVIDKIKAGVFADFQEDAKKAAVIYYREILKAIVMPPFEKKVFPACENIISPIADAIPEPFRPFCDINQLFEDLLSGIIESSIDTVLSGKD
jgi:hypothetical protein